MYCLVVILCHTHKQKINPEGQTIRTIDKLNQSQIVGFQLTVTRRIAILRVVYQRSFKSPVLGLLSDIAQHLVNRRYAWPLHIQLHWYGNFGFA